MKLELDRGKFIPHEKDEILVAFAGNPNVGKSTLFNKITGLNQHIGNWPGKTVEIAWSRITYKDRKLVIVDLPGTYSLSGMSEEEQVAIDFIINEKPDVTVVITDASALARNLYLLFQVLELTSQVILVVNMMDEAKKWGIHIDLEGLEKELGIPVIGTVALTGEGIRELLDAILHVKDSKIEARDVRYPIIEKYVQEISEIVKPYIDGYSARWIALRILEGMTDLPITLPQGATKKIEKITQQMRIEGKYDPKLLIVRARYDLVDDLVLKYIKRRKIEDEITEKIDLTIFKRGINYLSVFGIFYIIFWLAFEVGGYFGELIDSGINIVIPLVYDVLLSAGLSDHISRFIAEGVIGGVGVVLTFFPLVFIFYLSYSFIENLGIMARMAFIMDRIFSKLGLEGKAFFPLALSFGCNVVGVTATRILSSRKQKIMSMITLSFIPCAPRIAVLGLLISIVFPSWIGPIIFMIYILVSFMVVAFTAYLMNKITKQGGSESFFIELPPYRIPSLKVISKISLIRTEGFVLRAGKWMVLGSVIIWILVNIPPSASVEYTIAGMIGGILAIPGSLLGLGWREMIALLFGFTAKELTLSVLYTLYGSALYNLPTIIGFPTAVAFMTIYAYYTPCIATVAAIVGESGDKKLGLLSIFYSLVIALFLGVISYLIAILLT